MIVDPLKGSLTIAATGLTAQSQRLKVISENLANAQSTAKLPNGDPYRRKPMSFRTEVDRLTGAAKVKIAEVGKDIAPFSLVYEPHHPAADEQGYVKYPNVSMLVEMADMREANRSYEANLQVVKQARELISMTIDMMRNS